MRTGCYCLSKPADDNIFIEVPNPYPGSHLPFRQVIGDPAATYTSSSNPNLEVLEQLSLDQTVVAQAQDRRFSGQLVCHTNTDETLPLKGSQQ